MVLWNRSQIPLVCDPVANVTTLPSRIIFSHLKHCFVGKGVVVGERLRWDSQVAGKRSDG